MSSPDPSAEPPEAGVEPGRVDAALGEEATAFCAQPPRLDALQAPARPGAPFGAYRLIERVGVGGMGEVWRAEQQRPVQRMVALKMLQQRLRGTLAEALFALEAQSLARMRHPAVAQVYDAGSIEDQAYLAMEWVEGRTLGTWLHESADRSARSRLALLAEICRGAHHAHLHGLVHRDLKPDNILVVSEAGRDQPKIIDFGVAMNWAVRGRTGERGESGEAGTPRYMSPEQRAGATDLDPRSDVYALGVILLQLLIEPEGTRLPSGALPALDTLLAARAGLDAAPLPELRQALARLPEELRWMLRRALAEDRQQRYESALALAQDIERYLAKRPLEAGPDRASYRIRKFIERHLVPVTLGALALLGLIVGLAAALYGLGEARAQRAAALAAAEQARSQALRAERVSGFLRSILRAVDPAYAAGLDRTLMRRVLDDAAARARTELGDDPSIQAEVLALVGSTYRSIGEPQAAREALERALALNGGTLGASGDLEPWLALVGALSDLGDLAGAEALLADGLAGLPEPAVAARLQLETERAELMLRGPDHRTALEAAAALWPQTELTLGPAHAATLRSGTILARALAEDGRHEEAIALLRVVVERQSQRLGPAHPQTLRQRAALLIALLQSRDYEQALELAREQVALNLEVFGPAHPATIGDHSLHGSALRGLGRHDEAAVEFERAHAGFRDKFGPNHPHTVGTGYNVALSLLNAGRPAEAAGALDELAPLASQAFAPGHPIHTDIELAQLRARIDLDDLAGVEARLIDLHRDSSARLGALHAQPRRVAGVLAELYGKLGQAEQATRWQQRSLP